MNFRHRQAFRPAIFSVVAVVLVVTSGLFVLQEVSFRARFAETIAALRSDLEKHRAAYLDDRRLVATLAYFAPPGRANDAGPLLNSLVGWTAGSKFEALRQPAKGFLALPASFLDLAGKGEDAAFPEKSKELLTLDFRWMAQLEDYDHWDVHQGSPWQIAMRGAASGSGEAAANFLVEAPSPEWRGILAWVRLRWRRAEAAGDYVAASRQTRQIARLVASTETWTGSLVAASVLKAENRAFARAKAAGAKIPAGWKAPGEVDLRRLVRFLHGTPAFFTPLAPPELVRATLLDGPFLFWNCGAVAEGAAAQSTTRRLFSGTFPAERGFPQAIAALDGVVAYYRENCRFSEADRLWESGGLADTPLFGRSGFLRVPYLRAVMGATLVTVAAPSFLGKYDERLPASE